MTHHRHMFASIKESYSDTFSTIKRVGHFPGYRWELSRALLRSDNLFRNSFIRRGFGRNTLGNLSSNQILPLLKLNDIGLSGGGFGREVGVSRSAGSQSRNL